MPCISSACNIFEGKKSNFFNSCLEHQQNQLLDSNLTFHDNIDHWQVSVNFCWSRIMMLNPSPFLLDSSTSILHVLTAVLFLILGHINLISCLSDTPIVFKQNFLDYYFKFPASRKSCFIILYNFFALSYFKLF